MSTEQIKISFSHRYTNTHTRILPYLFLSCNFFWFRLDNPLVCESRTSTELTPFCRQCKYFSQRSPASHKRLKCCGNIYNSKIARTHWSFDIWIIKRFIELRPALELISWEMGHARIFEQLAKYYNNLLFRYVKDFANDKVEVI